MYTSPYMTICGVCSYRLPDPNSLLCLELKIPAEDIEGVPSLLNEILRLQGRSKKLLERCEKAGETKLHGPVSCGRSFFSVVCCFCVLLRQAETLNSHIGMLTQKHDELADMKSAYDSDEKVDHKMPDSKNPAK